MVEVRNGADKIRRFALAIRMDSAMQDQMLRGADREFRALEVEQFKSAGEPAWAPLSARYKARKDRLFAGAISFNKRLSRARGTKIPRGALGSENKILQLTGDMKRSFTMATDPAHVAQVEGAPERFKLVVGSRSKIAGYHFAGNAVLPVRKAIQLTEAQKKGIVRSATQPYLDRLDAARRRIFG